MKNRLILNNYYLTTIDGASSIDSVSDSGSFVVSTKTVEGYTIEDGEYIFFLTIDFSDVNKREIFRIYKVVGTTLYFNWRKSSSGPKVAHAGGAVVQLNDVAESINYLSANTDDVGMVEIIDTTTNAVRFKGGDISFGSGTQLTIPDVGSLAIANGSNHVIFNFTTSSVEVVQDMAGLSCYEFASVTSNGTYPTVITDKRGPFIGFDVSSITPDIQIGATTTGPAGSSAIVTNTGTGLEPILNFTIPKGDAGTMTAAPDGSSQIVVDNMLPLPGTVVETDDSTYVNLRLGAVRYRKFLLTGIYHFDPTSGEKTGEDIKTGTFGSTGITYSDGSFVDKITGIYNINGNPAYQNQSNTFTTSNIFERDTNFKGRTTFSYFTYSTSDAEIVIDGSLGMKQGITITGAAGARTVSFVNLLKGSTYTVVFINNTGGAVTITKGTDPSDSDGIIAHQKIGTATYPISVANGEIHMFVYETFSTAIHWSYVGPTNSTF